MMVAGLVSIMLLLLSGVNGYGQSVRIRNLTLMKPDSPILISHARNALEISAPTIPARELVVRVRNTAGQPVTELWRCASGDTLLLDILPNHGTVEIEIAHHARVILRAAYRAKRAVDPVACLGWLRGASAAKADILAQEGLCIVDTASVIRFARFARIMQYSFETNKGDDDYREQVFGAQVTPGIRVAISRLRPGSKIAFKDIVMVGADCMPRRLNDVCFVIR